LAAKEVLICENFTVLLRLGHLESLSPDSPEFLALHSLLGAEMVAPEDTSHQLPQNLQQDEAALTRSSSENDDLPSKRRRYSDLLDVEPDDGRKII
jgi:hypothetical protein